MTPNTNTPDLADWIGRISGREMPVFAHTVAALRRIVGDERASASVLAQVILKDVPMTTKVLRLANSAYFNQAQQGISTVSRAIVVLGFDPVAQLALSVALIDALLGGSLRSRVNLEMARSFHAAVQARWVVQRRGEQQGEQVFIAALLSRVGEMAFWCFGGEHAQALERCMKQGEMREEDSPYLERRWPSPPAAQQGYAGLLRAGPRRGGCSCKNLRPRGRAGPRGRRSAGSSISRKQSSQVALSGAISVRRSAPAWLWRQPAATAERV